MGGDGFCDGCHGGLHLSASRGLAPPPGRAPGNLKVAATMRIADEVRVESIAEGGAVGAGVVGGFEAAWGDVDGVEVAG